MAAFQCQICKKIFKSARSLANHCHSHGMTPKEYYDKFLIRRTEGICPVCGKPAQFKSIGTGYTIYCSMTCKMIAQHQDPSFAKANSERMRVRRRDPKFIEALNNSKATWWTDERKNAIKGYRADFLEKQKVSKENQNNI